MTHSPDIIVLFSGGLDSLLTSLLLQEQGLRVRCLHAVSPFFGKTEALPLWRERYGLDIHAVDVGDEFVEMLRRGPEHGYGKGMNPCVDCKILLLRRARQYMEQTGAKALATGEVLGQRPMSQRRDAMNLIMREAGVAGKLLRPLCAQHLPPTPVEESGLVDRSRLLGICGRGRGEQLALAASHFHLEHVPTPGGGCRLTEREMARRYWPVLTRLSAPEAADFALANLGRQFWGCVGAAHYRLCVGRDIDDNNRLEAAADEQDALIMPADVPGPLGLARNGARWSDAALEQACALTASYAPKALALDKDVRVHVRAGSGAERVVTVMPGRASFFEEVPPWEETRTHIRALTRSLLRLPA